MEFWNGFMDQVFLGNMVKDYLFSLVLLIVGFVAIRVLQKILVKNLKLWSEKTVNQLDDTMIRGMERNIIPLMYYGIIYLAIRSLILSAGIAKALQILGIVLVTFMGIRLIIELAVFLLLNAGKKNEDLEVRRLKMQGLIPAMKVVIWGIALVFLLDNLGFKVNSIIAGLGIGGIAIALAAQALLADLFGYFCILFDRPFEVGDFLILGDYIGSVEHIGIKTTRIRSLGGEQLVFSNTDLTNSRIRNYKRMQRRRIVFKLGVTYDTSLENLKVIPQLIKDIIEGVELTTFDRSHFGSYGDFNLVIETVYYVESSDYLVYMNIQQEINLKIKEAFTERNIEFAFPTQTLYLEKTSEN